MINISFLGNAPYYRETLMGKKVILDPYLDINKLRAGYKPINAVGQDLIDFNLTPGKPYFVHRDLVSRDGIVDTRQIRIIDEAGRLVEIQADLFNLVREENSKKSKVKK